MKTTKIVSLLHLSLMAFCLVGCCRSADDVWDDTRTAGRHMGRGLRSLGGKHGDSRQVCCREDFIQCREDYCIEDFQAMEFEPLPDQNYIEVAMVETKPVSTNQPIQEPGLPMSHIPGIEAFQDPESDQDLAQVFRNVHFPYNSSLIKGKNNMSTIRAVAGFLKKHPGTYLFVEGHCDERGAEAYNLALGARRSNSVRNLLIKEGVSPENIFTVSYGKERPLDLRHSEEAWTKNRRAHFKIYKL